MIGLLVAVATVAMAEMRTWTFEKSGKTIEGEVVGFSGEAVNLKRADGKTYSVPIAYLIASNRIDLVAERAKQRLAVPPNTNQLAGERLRGLTEFSVQQIENFPEQVSDVWGKSGWMDAVFHGLDGRRASFPEFELAFAVKDKNGGIFRGCTVYKRLNDRIDGPPNPLVQKVTALKDGDKVRLIGKMHLHVGARPEDAWFLVESIEPLQP